MRARSLLIAASVAILAAGADGVQAAASQQQPSAVSTSATSQQRALLDRYCVTCHNERLQTAELMLDRMDVANVSAGAEVWEKVVRKLRASAMPPVGRPRPEKTVYDGFVSWLEGALDREAAAQPDPGRTTTYHRLNRTEYQNAVRDLLAVEIDAASMLPGDDAAFGFDNIGQLLSVSPDLMDAYLSAANKISRLAVGDPALRLGSASYGVSKYLLQHDRMSEDLPFGSRGGVAIRHHFPYDGEYVFNIRFGGRTNLPQVVELRVDGARAAEMMTAGRDNQDPAEKGAVEARVAVKAGPRVVGVSFVQQMLEPETRYPQYYPWGHSAVFATTTGGRLVRCATLASIVLSPVVAGFVTRGQERYPIFTEEHLDRAMNTLGLAFALVTASVERNDAAEAKDLLARSREQLAPTIMFWKNRNRDDAIEMLEETLRKMDDLDAGLSADPVDPERAQRLARTVDAACETCHARNREQDPVTRTYRVKRELVQ